jgi:hypothetical protein
MREEQWADAPFDESEDATRAAAPVNIAGFIVLLMVALLVFHAIA